MQSAAAELAAARAPGVDSPDALDFLLATLGKDLHELVRVLPAPR